MSAPTPSKDPLTQPEPWNEVATGYDEELFARLPELSEQAIALLQPEPTATVLDVGTGPGALAVRLAPRVQRIVAIDFAENMLERLRGHLETTRIQNVAPLLMDGHALAFDDASFDRVVSLFGWFLFSDRPRALREMHRVLRPEGRVVVTSWATAEQNTLLSSNVEAIREVLPDLPRPSGPLPTQIPEVCATELRDAGFREVGTKILTLDVPMASVADSWRLFERAGAPVAVLRKRLGDAAWQAASERARAGLRARYGDGQFTLQAEAIYTFGTR